MSVYAVYFSPTHNSRKGAIEIANGLASIYHSVDISVLTNPAEKTEFMQDDVVVFGVPVYGGRIFTQARDKLAEMHGNNTPCIITVSYGNRDYDDALIELADLVKENSFIPVAAAALVGEHTYGTVQTGRPDRDDLKQDLEFAHRVSEKIKKGHIVPVEVPGNHPYKEGGGKGKFIPSTNSSCTGCGVCAAECPVQAINYDNYRKIDSTKCISCFRCIKICSAGAKCMDSPDYDKFAEDFSRRLAQRRENEYFI